MTEHKNDENNWIVAVLANGWVKVAKPFKAENMARDFAEKLAVGQIEWKDTDLDTEPVGGMDAVFVYERKGTVRAEKIAKWN